MATTNIGILLVAPSNGSLFTNSRSNDLLLCNQQAANIWLGSGSNAPNYLQIGSNTTFTSNLNVTDSTTLSNLTITGTVTGLPLVGSNQSFSNIYTSNVYASNASFSNITSTGSITAQTFIGALTGNASGLTGAPAISVASISSTGTITAPTFSGALTGNAATASTLSGTPAISTTSTTASNIYSSNIYGSIAAFSNLAALNTASFSNINFTGTLTQNGTAFVSGSSEGGSSSTSASNATFTNLTVTNSITLGSNTIGFVTGSANQITAQTWQYMQNYVYTGAGASNTVALTSVLMTGVASQHGAYIQSGYVYTFGNNNEGQLGIGSLSNSTIPVQVPGLSNATAVTCGNNYTTVLINDGTVYSMGGNAQGQLATGDTTPSTTPIKSPTLSNVSAISAGFAHTLFLLSDASVYGFGNGASGQLGNPSVINSINTTAVKVQVPYPAAAAGSSNSVLMIDSGANHSAILLNNGTAWFFGQNANGQCGQSNTSTATYNTPTQLAAFSNISNIACGQFHNLMVNAAGTVYAWGKNTFGQCGTGVTGGPDISYPQQIIAAPGAAAPTAGFVTYMAGGLNHSVVIKYDGSTHTFGDNQYGQLGQGVAQASIPTPTRLLMSYAVYTASNVACGANTTMLILNNDITVPQKNRIVAFGQNQYGQVGNAMYSPTTINGIMYNSNVPTPVPLTNNGTIYRKQLSKEGGGNDNHHLGYIDADGTLYMCGLNSDGQCGDGTTANKSVMSPISSFNFTNGVRITNFAIGQFHTAAIDSAGQVWSWGLNSSGQLGNGAITSSSIPILINSYGSLSGKIIVSIACGMYYTCALDSLGNIHAWGKNDFGQLGNGTTSSSSIPIAISSFGSLSGKTIVAISCGRTFTLAIDSSGNLHSWGENTNGQIGNGQSGGIGSILSPTPINTSGSINEKTIVAISCGYNHSVALDSLGNVHTWGNINYSSHANGKGTSGGSSSPVNISTISNINSSLYGKRIVSISASDYFMLALDSTGQVHIWGNDNMPNSTSSFVPILLDTFGSLINKTIIAISGSAYHNALAIDSTGQIHAWGQNNSGQLGINTGPDSQVPIPITLNNRIINPPIYSQGGLGDHKLLFSHNAAASNILKVVGANQFGQLGLSNTTNQSQIQTLTAFPANIVSYATGIAHSAVVLNTGVPYIWGNNSVGQCGFSNSTTNYLTPQALSTITNATQVACGSNTTFLILNDNSVRAMGDNTNNGLGVSSTQVPTFTNAIQVVPNLVNISQLVAGTQAGMALDTTNNKLYTWGNNSNGVTGQGTFTSTTATPTLVPSATFNYQTITKIAMGDHIAAVVAGGNLYTTGINIEGGLGISSNFGTGAINTFTQVPLSSTNYVVGVAQGRRHTVAHLANNTIRTFGLNTSGQLGMVQSYNSGVKDSAIYNTSNQYTPANPYGVPRIAATNISASANTTLLERFDQTTDELGGVLSTKTKLFVGCKTYTTLITTPSGALYGWGAGDYGKLGRATSMTTSTPFNITSIPFAIVAVAGGFHHTIALDSRGSMWAFGRNNFGQTGSTTNSGTDTANPTPTKITWTGIPIMVAIACGDYYTIALDSAGSMWGFGRNTYGQTGSTMSNGTDTANPTPTKITWIGIPIMVSIACGIDHTIALDSTGSMWGFGRNQYGQLGATANTTANPTPTTKITITGNPTMVAIACGGYHTIALDSTGSMWGFGVNYYGQLGSITDNWANVAIAPAKIALTGNPTIVAIACGQSHTIALDSTGAIWGFGYNIYGQLGTTANITPNPTPEKITITGNPTIVAIACGAYHTIALDSTGAIWGFGNNTDGQLGKTANLNTQTPNPTPEKITSGDLASLSLTAPVSPPAFVPFFVNFTGQHRVFIAGATPDELGVSEGFIVVCDQNDYITQGPANQNPYGQFVRGQEAITINDCLPLVSLAKKAYDKRVFGVISPDIYALTPENTGVLNAAQRQRLAQVGDVRAQINALGEGAIWVSNINGTLSAGDLITSSDIPGYGQLQSTDDIIHSYTVAKITCDCDFTSPPRPVYKIQTDENGLNVLDPITQQPMWIQKTSIQLQDPSNNNAIISPDEQQNMTQEQREQLVRVEVPLTEAPFKIRYLKENGTQIDLATYTVMHTESLLDATKPKVYMAAFVGCTYSV